MGVFGTILNFISGGIGGKLVDKVLAQLPDRLSDQEKADIQAAIVTATREHEHALLEMAMEAEEDFKRQIRQLEGTAQDLQQFGWFGRIIIFLRGAQRPIWGYAVLVMDFNIFSGQWNLYAIGQEIGKNGIGTNIESAFWVINFLVLGFLFGERALKNVLPLLQGMKKP